MEGISAIAKNRKAVESIIASLQQAAEFAWPQNE